ncbi:Stress responsive A/B Barrel Domain [Lachnospiraceae bacterium RM5]|nr:Stress responsive A/B Barrel Domain [Lachnospiraceae bacterium RM5]
MVKHVILWQLKDVLKEEEKKVVKESIKNGLEGLKGKIPGLLDINVQIDCLDSSNADVMLDSLFEDEASLKGYAIHPEHVAVADGAVRPNTKLRVCMDYVVD